MEITYAYPVRYLYGTAMATTLRKRLWCPLVIAAIAVAQVNGLLDRVPIWITVIAYILLAALFILPFFSAHRTVLALDKMTMELHFGDTAMKAAVVDPTGARTEVERPYSELKLRSGKRALDIRDKKDLRLKIPADAIDAAQRAEIERKLS